MNTKTKKLIFGGVGVAACALLLAGCNSFCSESDVANFMYGYDSINTTYFNKTEDGLDFIKTTFKTFKDVDKDAVDAATIKVVTHKEGTKDKTIDVEYAEDLVFGKVKDSSIYYIKPVTIKMMAVSTKETDGVKENISYQFGLNEFTQTLISTCASNGVTTPTFKYYEELDKKILDDVLKEASNSDLDELNTITKGTLSFENLYGYSYEDYKDYLLNGDHDNLLKKMKFGKTYDESYTNLGRNNALLARFGGVKFEKKEGFNSHYEKITNYANDLVKEGTLTPEDLPSQSYFSTYESTLKTKVNNLQTCISLDDGFYGNVASDGLNNTVLIEGKGKDFWKGWGDAFAKHGFLEGLFVYPIASLVETLSHSFGMNGTGQILAVLLVTVIVRLIFMLATLPITISQQKMQYLQPELAKIQAKYPNSKENQYEKQKLAQAQMALYKKHKVHPFLSFVVIFIQFPVFISVWNAMRGSASLSSDAVLGLRLSDTIWQTLTNISGWPALPGWWTALVLFLVMSGAQALAMFVPQLLNKKRMKSVEKTGVNPAQDQSNKTMKITQWVMTIFIIIMGATLPSAMGVYWFAGAIFNIAQSLIMHFVFEHTFAKKR